MKIKLNSDSKPLVDVSSSNRKFLLLICTKQLIKMDLFLFQSLLESPSVPDDETDLYNHSCILPNSDDHSPTKKWSGKNSWCKPSCIPISIILILIFLVVLLPLLDHTGDSKALINRLESRKNYCDASCR